MAKKQNNKVLKAVALALVGVLAGGAIGGAVGYKFGKNKAQEDDSEIVTPVPDPVTGADKADDPNDHLVVTPNETTNAPIKLAAKRLSDAIDAPALLAYSEENGISAQDAGNVMRLTATCEPSDAENKILDWTVAFQNPEATWAQDKTVTDYITVTPTSDGALTADVTCLKGFSEKIVVTAAVRGNESVNATCVYDYVRKGLGADITIGAKWNGVDQEWVMKYTQPNVTVDYLQCRSVNAFDQEWVFGWCNNYGSSVQGQGTAPRTITDHYSEDYTIDNGSMGYGIKVAATAEYIAALKEAGFNPKVAAEEYVNVQAEGKGVSLGVFTMTAFGVDFANYQQYVNMRAALKKRASSVMLRINYGMVGGADNVECTTIYNVKFSISSLTAVVSSVTLDQNTYRF